MTSPLRPGLSLQTAAEAIERAFTMSKLPTVAVVINSPGGSPVQSSLIFKRIRQLADENKKKVIVFCEDVAASGGYYLAVSGDEQPLADLHRVDVASLVTSCAAARLGQQRLRLRRLDGVTDTAELHSLLEEDPGKFAVLEGGPVDEGTDRRRAPAKFTFKVCRHRCSTSPQMSGTTGRTMTWACLNRQGVFDES